MRYLPIDREPPANVFIARHFLDASVCRELLEQAATGAQGPAYISGQGGVDLLDESRRRTRRVLVTEPAQKLVEQRLLAIVPNLERYFSSRFNCVQPAQFLRYRRGDFFRAHQDSSSHPEHPQEVRLRRVSAILFLNRQTRFPEAGAYCGGELTLFRVDDDRDPRLNIAGEEGLLVTFPSTVVHEVRPVTHGERYTVVTWYEGEGEGAGPE